MPSTTASLNPNAPIGLLDSGLGGLSVAREIRNLLPNESLTIVADSAWAPYGDKSASDIRHRCDRITGWLIARGCKTIVVACNTATAAAAPYLRERYDVPIVGMEPAVKPAAAATKNGIVGVMATTGTLESARFAALLGKFAGNIKVVTQPCPGLVERIEAGDLAGSRALLKMQLAPLLAASVDTLVLGCTHYPLIKQQIAAIVGNGVKIIDTGEAVARQVAARLDAAQLGAKDSNARLSLYTSGSENTASKIARQWLGEQPPIRPLPSLNHDLTVLLHPPHRLSSNTP